MATDPTGSGDPDFLIMGDLNSYAKEDPIDAIRAGADDVAGTGDDFTNLIAQYQGTYAYSFDGQAGYQDHSLASVIEGGSVTLGATGVDPEGTTVTFAWDLDNNASFESPGQNVSMHRRGITETIQTALGEFQVVVIANTSGASSTNRRNALPAIVAARLHGCAAPPEGRRRRTPARAVTVTSTNRPTPTVTTSASRPRRSL